MAINGNQVILKKLVNNQWQTIGYIRSQEPTTQADMLEVSNPNQGAWREFLSGRKGWTMTANWIVGVSSQIYWLLESGEKYKLRCVDRYNSSVYIEGFAYIDTCRITMMRGNICQGSFHFTGTGPLSGPTQ
jgi:hypothetical protein